ncbi:hypothetical protein [Enhygromyxa salina]|uniref:hypothetical protein n=1 Tax=Enhygromyxa salina TaxID=215803 RepID=UPI000D03931A|nr:hypothetical protein [Enhygromyxa salina]
MGIELEFRFGLVRRPDQCRHIERACYRQTLLWAEPKIEMHTGMQRPSTPPAAATSEHQVRLDVKLRGAVGTAIVAGFGVALLALAATGEILWWAALPGALMIGLVPLGARQLARTWRLRVILDDDGISWAPAGVSLPWSQVRRVNYVVGPTMSGPRTSAIEIVSRTDMVFRLGPNLTDWSALEARVRARFAKSSASGNTRRS